jgi:hypothetical protein
MSGKQVKVMTPQESAAAAAAAALREEADENFKQFVLYIKHGDSNSENALRLLKSSPRLTQCVIQDVGVLPLPRPAWLVSVPTLVDRHANMVKRGSAAIEQLSDWAALASAAPRSASAANNNKGYLSAAMSFNAPE